MAARTRAQRRTPQAPTPSEPARESSTPGESSSSARPQELDGLIHERTRLGIVGALAATERLSFVELKGILKTTDGNLSAHARKLEDVGYIRATKRFEGRLPRTEYELTPAGRSALERYLDQMDRVLSSMRGRPRG